VDFTHSGHYSPADLQTGAGRGKCLKLPWISQWPFGSLFTADLCRTGAGAEVSSLPWIPTGHSGHHSPLICDRQAEVSSLPWIPTGPFGSLFTADLQDRCSVQPPLGFSTSQWLNIFGKGAPVSRWHRWPRLPWDFQQLYVSYTLTLSTYI
jgi:hypothetical protein